jgi:hypothetical protein
VHTDVLRDRFTLVARGGDPKSEQMCALPSMLKLGREPCSSTSLTGIMGIDTVLKQFILAREGTTSMYV